MREWRKENQAPRVYLQSQGPEVGSTAKIASGDAPTHSPLPWTLEVSNRQYADEALTVRDAEAMIIMSQERQYSSTPYERADWDLILKSVNAHSALVEALKACLQMAWTAKPRKLDEALSWVENDEKAREMARAALALAEPTS